MAKPSMTSLHGLSAGPATSRRKFLTTTAAIATAAAFPRMLHAQGKPEITVVEWGGLWIETVKALAAKQSDVNVQWQLHAGGAAAILPRIKAAWLRYQYDVVAAWDAIYFMLMNEGWLEPLSPDEIPNMRDIPDRLFFRNKENKIINVPSSLTGKFWGYTNNAPFKLENLDQLTDKRLNGQICWLAPIHGGNAQLLSLAFHRGGSEDNLEPGWQFLKEIAKSGNIGRVTHTDTDFINSLASGETSVAIGNFPSWQQVAGRRPCTFLNRVAKQPGFRAFLYQEGWVVLNNAPNKAAAKKFINHLITPENNEYYNLQLGMPPINRKSKAGPVAQPLAYTEAEMDEFTYIPNFYRLSQQVDGMVKRFEQEITPLL